MKQQQQILFTEKPTYRSAYSLASTANYTPIFMQIGEKELFVRNIINGHKEEVAQFTAQLVENNGAYFCNYCHARGIKNPIEFLQFVKERGFTFEEFTQIGKYNSKESGFIDFGGNLREYSSAFDFRIYDMELVKEIETLTGLKNQAK